MDARSSFNRRRFVLGAAGATVLASQLSPVSKAATAQLGAVFKPFAGPRSRVVFVNDLSGDPDGLFATVHQVLSPSTDLRCIVGTSTGQFGETAEKSASLASDILKLMGRAGHCPVYRGADSRLTAMNTPVRSPGTQALIDEAMRASDLPLYADAVR